MSFLIYLFVVLVAAGSVLFGLDWLQSPLSPQPEASAIAVRTPPPPMPRTTTVQTDAPKPPPAAASTAPAPAAARPAEVATAGAVETAAAVATPRCDITACTRAYRSFDAADCTYQPSDGPRRLCRKGTPPRAAAPPAAADAARAQACNADACARAYKSFDPATCTYQPYGGPRRACTK